MAAPDWETRLIKLEQQIIPLAASQTPKISTKVAGILTTVATGLGYVLASAFLSPTQSAVVAVVVAGIGSFVTAEQT